MYLQGEAQEEGLFVCWKNCKVVIQVGQSVWSNMSEESGCTNAVVDGGGGGAGGGGGEKDGNASDDEVYAAICDDGEEYIDKVIKT